MILEVHEIPRTFYADLDARCEQDSGGVYRAPLPFLLEVFAVSVNAETNAPKTFIKRACNALSCYKDFQYDEAVILVVRSPQPSELIQQPLHI